MQLSKNLVNLHYFGLEPIKNRYTEQLTNSWFPEHLRYGAQIAATDVQMAAYSPWHKTEEIKSGVVLDAVQRSCTALLQSHEFILRLPNLKGDNNVLFLQDFWNPGLDGILYTMSVLGVRHKWKIYAMLHAQSVDEYDFTWNMQNWMRGIELGYASQMDGVFVASTVHRDLLRQANFGCPIHVVGLPIGAEDMLKQLSPNMKGMKKRQVIFTSRYDWEKNPLFLARVIRNCMESDPTVEFVCTTGASILRSNCEEMLKPLLALEEKYRGRFRIERDITKERYYKLLSDSQVQFNCSLQDFVSWTLLESICMGCVPVYPRFRSFNEIFDTNFFMYHGFDVANAASSILTALNACNDPTFMEFIRLKSKRILELNVLGGDLEAAIILGKNMGHEINIWQEGEGLLSLYGRS